MQTGYLAGLLLSSLVLPLMISFRGPQNAEARRSCMKTVWLGQTLCVLAAFAAFTSASLDPYAVGLGVVCYILCVLDLLRKFRASRRA